MAKALLKLKARTLRSKGESVKTIARKLGVSKSTVSLWVRDIILSIQQLEKLRLKRIVGSEKGRLKGAFLQKEKRLKIIQDSSKEGKKIIRKLSEREFFIAGLALYWAEGTKKSRKLRFVNSDPKMIILILKWFRKFFKIDEEEIKATVGINEIHKQRDGIVKQYWSDITGIPINKFRKTSFKKVKNQKVYDNFNEHFGTLVIDILKPARFYYKIVGLIEALSTAG